MAQGSRGKSLRPRSIAWPDAATLSAMRGSTYAGFAVFDFYSELSYTMLRSYWMTSAMNAQSGLHEGGPTSDSLIDLPRMFRVKGLFGLPRDR